LLNLRKEGAEMRNNLDDLDFTKLGEDFDQKHIENSPLLSDDHDDNTHIDHSDAAKQKQLQTA
jgi:hypothetical protein